MIIIYFSSILQIKGAPKSKQINRLYWLSWRWRMHQTTSPDFIIAWGQSSCKHHSWHSDAIPVNVTPYWHWPRIVTCYTLRDYSQSNVTAMNLNLWKRPWYRGKIINKYFIIQKCVLANATTGCYINVTKFRERFTIMDSLWRRLQRKPTRTRIIRISQPPTVCFSSYLSWAWPVGPLLIKFYEHELHNKMAGTSALE